MNMEIQDQATALPVGVSQELADGFKLMLQYVQDAAGFLMGRGNDQAYHTNVPKGALKEAFLSGFSTPEARQYHNCDCCLSFIKRFGDLVVIDRDTNTTIPLLWNAYTSTMHPDFARGIEAMRKLVAEASITGPFYNRTGEIGLASYGGWEHFSFKLGFTDGDSRTKTVGQCAAERREDHRILREGLSRFSVDHLERAYNIFKLDEVLKYYPRWIEILDWAIKFKKKVEEIQDRRKRDVYVWEQATLQPKGRTHMAQTCLGKFLGNLDDSGKYEGAKAAFLSMVDSKDYMRPKALPTASNVKQAEAIIDKIGARESLRRRALRRGEVTTTYWRPKPVVTPASTGGVFDHIKTKDEQTHLSVQAIDGGNITMNYFMKRVMDSAEKIELYVPAMSTAFGGMVTAVDPHAPNIHKWANGISSYHYVKPVPAEIWGLRGNSFVDVFCLTTHPHSWGADVHDLNAFVFVLAEGYDHGEPTVAIFPDNLHSDFHAVRATIEEYAKTARQEAVNEGLVGYTVQAGSAVARIRVTSAEGKVVTMYNIDRFE